VAGLVQPPASLAACEALRASGCLSQALVSPQTFLRAVVAFPRMSGYPHHRGHIMAIRAAWLITRHRAYGSL
jgi:hypothetical protein